MKFITMPGFVVLLAAFLIMAAGIGYAQDSLLISKLESIEWLEGPGTADIGSLAEITIPENYIFTGREGTETLMELFENPLTEMELGYLQQRDHDWYVIFEFEETGYISDDEKNDLDADAIFSQIKEANEAGNVERKKRGWGTISAVDWVQRPQYDEISHNLEWAPRLVDENGEYIINYNTRILGRSGVMYVTFVISSDSLITFLPEYKNLISNFAYKPGNTYAEYREGDKLAEYGLTALIAGGGAALAAKSGLFKWLWKIILIGLAGAAGFFKKIFGKKKKDKNPYVS